MAVSVTFLTTVTASLTQATLRRRDLSWLTVGAYSPVRHGGKCLMLGAGGSWFYGFCKQEAERGRSWYSAHLLLMLLRTPVDGVVPPTFGAALSTSVNQV